MQTPAFEDILAAAERIAPYVRRTPVLENEAFNDEIGAKVLVKAESLQRFGAFKARGAFSKLTALTPEVRARGVVAFSSGNHAQAVAGAARVFGAPAVIVMPSDAPRMKIDQTRAHGAEVVLYDRISEDREAIARMYEQDRGLTMVPPFDDAHIIAGQGTVGLELAADAATLDVVLACASGGGLGAGVALSVRQKFPNAEIYVVEPVGHEDIARSLASGRVEKNSPGVRSICDALMAEKMGELPFAIAQDHWAGAFAVSDDNARAAMRAAFQRFKIVLEPGGAAALAALMVNAERFRGKTVGVIASGANVDAETFITALQG
jgi:threonine dehydratase